MASRKDVAERAGVSVAVVSYVLNNRSIVKEETRRKVLEAVQELGYRPNQAARSLKTKRTGQIAVLVHFLGNPFEAGLLLHIERTAKHRGYSVMFHSFDPEREEELKSSLMGRVDGILLLGQTLSADSVDYYRSLSLSLVSVMRPVEPDSRIPFVDIDWMAALRRLIAHLRERGHERIAYMAAGEACPPLAFRLKAFREAMRLEGLALPESRVLTGDGRFEQARAALSAAIRDGVSFTALVCANDLMAAGSLAACRNAGWRTPDDLAIAGCENILMSSQTHPALTAISYPREEAGAAAMQMLLELIEGGDVKQRTLRAELVVRASTE